MPRVGVSTAIEDATGRGVGLTVAERLIIRITPGDGRVRVHLVMPGINRSVEITASPATALHALDDAAARAGLPPSQVHADARRSVEEVAVNARAWRPADPTSLDAQLGGASFPLLGAAYDAGAAPVGTVPPWAHGILTAPDPRHGARIAFGDRATRPVIAALARSLVRAGDGPVDLSRLALALMGSEVLEPDRIAVILTAPGDPWPSNSLPSPGRIVEARSVAQRWGGDRTLGYLTEAAADGNGRRAFDDCVTYAVEQGSHAPVRLPRRLDELRDTYRLHIRTVATTGTQRPTPRHPPVRGRRDVVQTIETPPPATTGHTRRATSRDLTGVPVDYGLHYPPRVRCTTAITDGTAIVHPVWLRAIHQTHSGGYSFVLPHTYGDLARWARLLGNCLDTFGAAAVEGASHLVGVEFREALRFVIEIDPDRRIRQFTGPANRRPGRRDHDAIVTHLRAAHILA